MKLVPGLSEELVDYRTLATVLETADENEAKLCEATLRDQGYWTSVGYEDLLFSWSNTYHLTPHSYDKALAILTAAPPITKRVPVEQQLDLFTAWAVDKYLSYQQLAKKHSLSAPLVSKICRGVGTILKDSDEFWFTCRWQFEAEKVPRGVTYTSPRGISCLLYGWCFAFFSKDECDYDAEFTQGVNLAERNKLRSVQEASR
jgi:hypothetical protein